MTCVFFSSKYSICSDKWYVLLTCLLCNTVKPHMYVPGLYFPTICVTLISHINFPPISMVFVAIKYFVISSEFSGFSANFLWDWSSFLSNHWLLWQVSFHLASTILALNVFHFSSYLPLLFNLITEPAAVLQLFHLNLHIWKGMKAKQKERKTSP